MKQTITRQIGTVILLILFVFGMVLSPAQAHNGVDHNSAEETVAHESDSAEIAKLEQILALLNQLVLLINALHIQQGYAPVHTTPVVIDDHDEMEEHHDEHSSAEPTDDTEEDTPHLVIEIETHDSGTHAHVRYVDKAEEMFFVTAGIDDEDGIVSGIVAKTGLSADAVQGALKYME